MKTYFAIVHKDEDSAVGVVFPDLPGCFSAYDKAIANAHAALRLYAEAELSAGRRLPKPRTFEALYRNREVREEAKDAPFLGICLEMRASVPAAEGSLERAEGGRGKRKLPKGGPGGASGRAKSKTRGRKAG